MADDKIGITKGDSEVIQITITDEDGSAFDLTGYTVTMTVRKCGNEEDADAILKKSVTSHLNPTGGITVIELSPTETDIVPGIYIYDVQVSKATPVFVRTVIKDIFEVVEDITNA